VLQEFPTYTCYTLFEIPDKGDRNTIRNWNTVVQVLSLRTQPIITRFPSYRHEKLNKYEFGKQYKGDAKVWSFKFTFEHPELFVLDDNPIGNLIQDSNLIPMIDHTNTIIGTRCLLSSGDFCNTYFTIDL
jgi:hypothetical protein